MSSKNLALVSIFVNFLLALGKFLVGLTIASVALVAEGIHSALDVFSSAIAYLGIAQLEKGEDEKYPYGRYRFESVAAFTIVIFLAGSALWSLWEAYQSFLNPGTIGLSITGIIVMAISIIFNEIMARYKFKIGSEQSSLALVADAEHDRADVISSVGVLVGLFIIPYFNYADAIIASLVGIYIIYESIQLARETIDSLVDVADEEIEKKIEALAKNKDLEIKTIKSRKIGATSFAEVELELPANLKLAQATKVSEDFENLLLKNISNLKQVVISTKSHQISRSTIKQGFGFGRYRQFGKGGRKLERSKQLKLPRKKEGATRIITAIDENDKITDFGSKRYLVEDYLNNDKIFSKTVANPFYSKEGNRGARFVRAAEGDRVVANKIGPGAKENLTGSGVKIEIKN